MGVTCLSLPSLRHVPEPLAPLVVLHHLLVLPHVQLSLRGSCTHTLKQAGQMGCQSAVSSCRGDFGLFQHIAISSLRVVAPGTGTSEPYCATNEVCFPYTLTE